MVPLCALSPPWWRQCFHWLSSSVAYWWKWPSLDWAPLLDFRTLDILGTSLNRLDNQRFLASQVRSPLPREALTLLYIGGASSSSSLLSCQETDGANEAGMGIFFRGHRCGDSDGKIRKIWVEMLRMRYQHRFLNGVLLFDGKLSDVCWYHLTPVVLVVLQALERPGSLGTW